MRFALRYTVLAAVAALCGLSACSGDDVTAKDSTAAGGTAAPAAPTAAAPATGGTAAAAAAAGAAFCRQAKGLKCRLSPALKKPQKD